MRSFFGKLFGNSSSTRQNLLTPADANALDDALIRDIKNPFQLFESWMGDATNKKARWIRTLAVFMMMCEAIC